MRFVRFSRLGLFTCHFLPCVGGTSEFTLTDPLLAISHFPRAVWSGTTRPRVPQIAWEYNSVRGGHTFATRAVYCSPRKNRKLNALLNLNKLHSSSRRKGERGFMDPLRQKLSENYGRFKHHLSSLLTTLLLITKRKTALPATQSRHKNRKENI